MLSLTCLMRTAVAESKGLQQKPALPARSHLWWLLAGSPGSRRGEGARGEVEGRRRQGEELELDYCIFSHTKNTIRTNELSLQKFKRFLLEVPKNSGKVHNKLFICA
jgi:hypothetical protein